MRSTARKKVDRILTQCDTDRRIRTTRDKRTWTASWTSSVLKKIIGDLTNRGGVLSNELGQKTRELQEVTDQL